MISNHTQLLDCLESEIASNALSDMRLALLILKIDGMYKLDSLLGYRAVDMFAHKLGFRLQDVLRDKDILGKLGRDEFCMILPGIFGEGQAVLAANKIQRMLELPIEIDGHQVYPLSRVGIALFPEHGSKAEQLLKQSMLATQEAIVRKESFVIFDPAHEQLNRFMFELEMDLRKALAENELSLWYQPQVDLRTGRIVSSESLLRWTNGAKGYVSPGIIVSVAEKSGLISSLSTWVVNTALRQWSENRAAGLDLTMSINFSVSNLQERELPEFVDQALRTWNVPADKIVVEITESAVMDDYEKSIDTLKRLKEIGVKLSLDDFGTGYSSMSHLRMLPLDEIKIDLSFIKNMLQHKDDEKIVRAIIELGHNFDLEVIAEGVENQETADRLNEIGCDKIQGYLVSPALPRDQFQTFCDEFGVSD
ncbi:putative bifunctional diguanylate cyclase/phosphodiesterase [Sulfurirhabdus autotrophica]|uniref:Diguanylate cyclase (GGDEF)-like protein n=1 Tax=Sulfurirhabdus autotrophica TaxID=1706046 RepID=A0A4R3YED1_9PROT|nr:GGDEF domain-containing phosphodiesterase [Sulfurirhabdus autotrophica]TCV90281.1 diguanylate cyclase (GGDEF)-like protein [Sulfurirhabdus autotrophica]